MAGSSPLRRQSQHWPSPQRSAIEEILAEDRNSEARHRYLLEAAKKEHDRIREDAERVYREQLQKEERERLLDERRKEEQRIRLEEQLAADRVKLNALRAKKIEIPPPLPEPEPPAAPAVNGKTAPAPPAPAQANGTTPTTSAAGTSQSLPTPKPQAAVLNKALELAKPPAPAVETGIPLKTAPQANGVVVEPGTSRSVPTPPTQPALDRYAEIHKDLKILRKSMLEQAKANPALKGRMGDMRREIRKSVGQLTVSSGVPGTNRSQVRAPRSLSRAGCH